MRESVLQAIMETNDDVQKSVCQLLGVPCSLSDSVTFEKQIPYPDRTIIDIVITCNDEVYALIELKGGDINITEFNRGVGQLTSNAQKIVREIQSTNLNYEYAANASAVLMFPSEVLQNVDISQTAFPEGTILLEINSATNVIRIIDIEKEPLIASPQNNLQVISQYYFRDNRVVEYYILLKHLHRLKLLDHTLQRIDRTELENNFLSSLDTPNPGNWRNAFITLSRLGLIDSTNLPTHQGIILGSLSYEDFAIAIYKSYLKPYFAEFFRVFGDVSQITTNNVNLCSTIRAFYNGRDVRFLTESNGRYISSFLNMLRDDYNAISFAPRQSYRRILYNPNDLRDEALKRHIAGSTSKIKYLQSYVDAL